MSIAFGGHLPHLGRDTTRDGVLRFATSLEEWGYDSVWTSDHIAWPTVIENKYPYSADGSFPGAGLGWLDAISTLTFAAAVTTRVKLGVSVLIPALIVVVVGGLGSLKGSLVGSLIIGQAETFGKVWLPGVSRSRTRAPGGVCPAA